MLATLLFLLAAFALVFAAGCSHDPEDGGSVGDTAVSGDEGEAGGNLGDEGASGGNEGETGGDEGAEGDSSDGDDAETEPVAITADDVQSVFNALYSIVGTTQGSSTKWSFCSIITKLAEEEGVHTYSCSWPGALYGPSISATFSNLTSQDVSAELLTAKFTDISDWETKPTVNSKDSGSITVGIELASGASGYYIPDELQSVTIVFNLVEQLNLTWAE